MAFKVLSGIVVGSAVLLISGQALAQTTLPPDQDNFFARDHNVSVRERSRPGYEALGLPLNGFVAYPKVEIGAEDNSNIYGTPNHGVNDVIGVIKPEVDINSTWSRHSLDVFARSSTRVYGAHENEDTTDYQFGGKAMLDLSSTTATLSGDYGYLAEPRTASVGQFGQSQFASQHPIEYYLSEVNLDVVHTFNRLKIEGLVGDQNYAFQNAHDAAQQLILVSPFDFNRTNAAFKAGYAVSPDTAVYGAVSYNALHYPNSVASITGTKDRDSSGETYDLGANFDLTQLIRGDVSLGYLHQDFAAAGVKPIDGFHAIGKVEWFPTQLTTVTFNGGRDVKPATLPGSGAIIASTAGGQIDHELLRNVILTGIARWEADNYQGITRQDNIEEFTISGDYLLNRGMGLHLAYDYLTQDSTGANRGVNFNDSRVTLSTTLQY